jgi:hypothetical protein
MFFSPTVAFATISKPVRKEDKKRKNRKMKKIREQGGN